MFLINKVRGDYKVESKSNIVYRVKHFMENGDITRRKNWYSAYSVIKNNIIFGVGIGDGENEMQNYREKGTWIYKAKLNAHNQYLEEFVHFGIIGFGSLVIFIGLLFFISYKNLLSLLFCSILAFSMITESILNRQVGVTLFSFFIAILLYDKLITDESILIVRI